jgi:hypothetical protein
MWEEAYMGSFLSGNFRPHMTTVESCLCLDLLLLVWLRAVQAGARRQGTICWPAGARRECAATIGYEVDMTGTPGMQLTYGYQCLKEATPAAQIEQLTYRVLLVTTPQHYGGCKWWFQCPLVRDGMACAMRVRQLYLPPGGKYFGCKRCYRLTYASRQTRQLGQTSVREWPAITVECTERAEKRMLHALRRFAERTATGAPQRRA